MGSTITLTASDGHTLDAYQALPQGEPKAGLVIVQEAFGVNFHIRDVCDGYAADGFAVVSPALYDRQQKGAEFGYGPDDMPKALEIRKGLVWDLVMLDVDAAIKALPAGKKVGVIGYCVGGSVSWLTACRLKVDAAVCYYPSDIVAIHGEKPQCPVMLHFAENDRFIPLDGAKNVMATYPDLPAFIYEGASHGFNGEGRPSHHPEGAKLARQRTLDFFAENLES